MAHALPPCVPGRDRPQTVISPSILSADFALLAAECKRMVDFGAEWLHVDVMATLCACMNVQDGHFVPNLTIGAPVVASLRKHTSAFLDCHLMVAHPVQWVQDFAKAGADMFTFHLEAVQPELSQLSASEAHPEVLKVCQAVRAAGMHCGIALKPATDEALVSPYVEAGLVDLVLILTVEPGFGGQKFMADKVGKVQALRTRYPHLTIEVDGGVAPSTIEAVAAAGANAIVAGSAIFGADDPGKVIQALRQAVDTAAAAR
ncbi:hypothetical protein QJQ45_021892 [Haematococcus lacustris]|nr:hypothetical protein QJQ45_021892 [Haematococcus lacustris]